MAWRRVALRIVRTKEGSGGSEARMIPDNSRRVRDGYKGKTMRSGLWRGTPLALTLTSALGLAVLAPARADGLLDCKAIPRTVAAYDFTTGQQYMAPPVPYGHYAKDPLGSLASRFGCMGCGLGLHGSNGNGLFNHDGNGLFGHDGNGPCGHSGNGLFGSHGNGPNCDPCGRDGLGHGLFHKGSGRPCPGGIVCGFPCGHGKTCASAQAATPQTPQASAQSACGLGGCKLKGKHGHGGLLSRMACGRCGGAGCDACGASNGGHGWGHGGTGCGLCGGRGCGNCLSGMMGGLKGRLGGLLHPQPKVKWFLGAGGPVPLTPGYVPYIVTTRSPRDYFAFPPMNPNAP
jgi:hypothetical protein